MADPQDVDRLGDPSELPKLVAGARRSTLALLIANGIGQAGMAATTALLARAAFDRLAKGGAQASVGALLPYAGGLAGAGLVIGFLRGPAPNDGARFGEG